VIRGERHVAKSDGFKGPSKTEELRWRAEDIVRSAMKESPAYKAAVKQAMAELRSAEKSVGQNFKKK